MRPHRVSKGHWLGWKLLVGGLLLLVLGGCAVDTTTPSNGPELIAQGQDLYWVNCAGCHQYEGQGWRRLYPNLAGNPIVTLHDASPLVETVLNGQGSMPGFRGQLSSDEIAAVLSYIRNAWGNTADPVSPKQVK